MTFRKYGWALVITVGSLFLAVMLAARRMERERVRLQTIRTREIQRSCFGHWAALNL